FFQAEDGIRDFHVTGVQTCALPIFYKHYLPYKKVIKIDRIVFVYIGIKMLFKRKIYIEPDGFTLCLSCALVSSLHNSGSATSDDTEANTGNFFGDFSGKVVRFVSFFQPRRSEDGNARTYFGQFIITVHKFSHYFKDHPAVLTNGLVPGFLPKVTLYALVQFILGTCHYLSQAFSSFYLTHKTFYLKYLSANAIASGFPTSTKCAECSKPKICPVDIKSRYSSMMENLPVRLILLKTPLFTQ